MKQFFSCPVCQQALNAEERRYVCERGHAFDIARQGYVNLLCGQGAAAHGDNKRMIAARGRFLEGGYYAPLADALETLVAKYAQRDAVLLDIGCGEGYYTERAARALSPIGGRVFAFDISKEALRAAARRRSATLFVAGAYHMPVCDEAVDMAMLFFSPFAKEEILRVLKPGGIFVMAYPGVRHLFGLKQAIYETPYLNRPEDAAIEGFSLLEKRDISEVIHLASHDAIMDLFAMTPYYYKTSEKDKAKLASLASLSTEISFHLCVYKKNYSTRRE